MNEVPSPGTEDSRCFAETPIESCARGSLHWLAHFGFLRDKESHEIDAIVECGDILHAIEAKSWQTVPTDAFKGLDFWRPKLQPGKTPRSWLVYGGDSAQHRENVTVLPWHGLAPLLREL